MKVNGKLNNLRQLVLLEEFKNRVSSDIRTYLNEKNITELSPAAIAADDYFRTH
jgi:hypothetical protein